MTWHKLVDFVGHDDIAGLGAQTTHGFGAIRLQRLSHAPPNCPGSEGGGGE